MTALHRFALGVVLPITLLAALPGLTLAQIASGGPAPASSAIIPATTPEAMKMSRMDRSATATAATRRPSAGTKGATTNASPGAAGEGMKHVGMTMPAAPGSAAMGQLHGSDMHAPDPVPRPPGGPAAAAPMGSMKGTGGMAGMDAPVAPSDPPGHGMDHVALPGMGADASQHMPHGGQPTEQVGRMPGMSATPALRQRGMTMGTMQGGKAPAGARSPDYSDGVPSSTMPGMHMRDNAALAMLRVDQLETFAGNDAHGQHWDMQAWYGNDANKLWLRSEGDRSGGKVEDAGAELLWSHAVASYWDTQLGLRHDFGDAPGRSWAAFGVQGLAPYWFDVEATAYVGTSGRTAARLRADYDVLVTQRLILQPELEINAYGSADRARRIGSGLSDGSLGLRLRYEVRRQFAPYIGIVWTRRFGATADFARADRKPVFDRQWVAGLRLWF